jgi:hypothetical protein
MLAMCCKDAEERGVGLLTASTISAMDCLTLVGLSDDLGSEHEENDVESVNNGNNEDDSILAQSDTPNSNDDDISDDDEQQVFILLYIDVI